MNDSSASPRWRVSTREFSSPMAMKPVCAAPASARRTGSSAWTRSNLRSSKRAAGFPSFRNETSSLARTAALRAGISATRSRPPQPRLSRGRLTRRHDLLGGAPHQFGHVIELEGEAAHAGSGGAHLHDEIADLRFRHLHPHHVPAVPPLARVEAEDLAAPTRHHGVHFSGRLGRADDLDLLDRPPPAGPTLRRSPVERAPPGAVKCPCRGSDRRL